MAKNRKNSTPFLRKDVKKTFLPSIANGAIRGGSAIAAGALSNATQNIIPRAHGPVMMLLGLAGDVLLENDQARAVTEGLGVWGAIETAKEFIPNNNFKVKLGLGATDSAEDGDTVIDSTPDWDALAEEADIVDEEEGFVDAEEEDNIDAEIDDNIKGVEEAQSELEALEASMF